MLKIQEFARRGGVSIRALRHYDSLGLLRPSARSRSGYRLYDESDLERLHQIVALKAFGLSLTDIARALKKESALSTALAAQLHSLLEQRRIVTDAIDAVVSAQRNVENGRAPDWRQLAMRVKNGGDASQLEQARRRVMERRRQWTPSAEDIALMRDIKAALDRNETSESQTWKVLVDRLTQAIDRFTGGDPELRAAFRLVMADQANWPSAPIGVKLKEFFNEAIAALSVVH
jgi:DNA-binding transcriptional MerR regulator